MSNNEVRETTENDRKRPPNRQERADTVYGLQASAPAQKSHTIRNLLIGLGAITGVGVGSAVLEAETGFMSKLFHSDEAAKTQISDAGTSDANSDTVLDGGNTDASPDAGQKPKVLNNILAAKIASAPAIDKTMLSPTELAHQRPRFQLKNGKWEALPNDKANYPVFKMTVDSEPVFIAVYYNSALERTEGPHITLGKGGAEPTAFVRQFIATMDSTNSKQWGFVAIGQGCASDGNRDRTNLLYNTATTVYENCPDASYTGTDLDVSPTLKGN